MREWRVLVDPIRRSRYARLTSGYFPVGPLFSQQLIGRLFDTDRKASRTQDLVREEDKSGSSLRSLNKPYHKVALAPARWRGVAGVYCEVIDNVDIDARPPKFSHMKGLPSNPHHFRIVEPAEP